jgi:hypothetical protein
MEKKLPYEKPSVRKVSLEVKTAVLGFCHTSPNSLRKVGSTPCTVIHCYGS